MSEELAFVFRCAVSLWSVAIVVFDLRNRRLPNGLTFGGLLTGAVVLVVWGQGMLGASVVSCVLALFLALLLTLPAYARKALGAGDVKLMMAIALMGGVRVLGFTFVMAGLFTAVWLVYYFAVTRTRVAAEVGVAPAHPGRSAAVRPVPFGAALGLGLLCTINLPMEWLHAASSG